MALENEEPREDGLPADELPDDELPAGTESDPGAAAEGGFLGAVRRRMASGGSSAIITGLFVVVGASIFVLAVVGINVWMAGNRAGPTADRAPAPRTPIPTLPLTPILGGVSAQDSFKPRTATPVPTAGPTPTTSPPTVAPTAVPTPTSTPFPIPKTALEVFALFDAGIITAEQAAAMLKTFEISPDIEPTETPPQEPSATEPPATETPDAPQPPGGTLLQLADPLDEPEFYCVDVVVTVEGVMLDRPLQAHTCKPGAADQLFEINRPAEGQVYLAAYDRCLAAREQSLYVEPCSGVPEQRFEFRDDGRILISGAAAGSGACLTVAAGEGEDAGEPSHVRRDLLAAPCAAADPTLTRWALPGPTTGGAS